MEPVPTFRRFLCIGAGVFRIEWGDVMKKLFGSSFPWMFSWNKSPAMNTEESTVLGTAGLIKLWHFTIAVLVGTILLGFSAPVMGQAVNATLLGTITDASGAVVAGAKVTVTEMKTGVSRSTTTNDRGIMNFPIFHQDSTR